MTGRAEASAKEAPGQGQPDLQAARAPREQRDDRRRRGTHGLPCPERSLSASHRRRAELPLEAQALDDALARRRTPLGRNTRRYGSPLLVVPPAFDNRIGHAGEMPQRRAVSLPHVMRRGALGVKSPMDRLRRGYARASRVSSDRPFLRHGRKRKPLKHLQVSDLIGSRWLTRQRRRVSTQNRRLAWVFVIAFAR